MVASDLRFEPDGLIIELRRSKADQDAAGDTVLPSLDELTIALPTEKLGRIDLIEQLRHRLQFSISNRTLDRCAGVSLLL
jgi:hypothetical protein